MEALAPLPVAIPLLVASVLIAGTAIFPRRLLDSVALLTAVTVTVLCLLLLDGSLEGTVPYWFAGWEPSDGVAIGIAFVVEPMSAGLAALAGVLMTAALLFSWRYFQTVGALYHALMLVFLAAMCGFSFSGDLFNMFVFFELMSVAAYALTGYKIEERGPLQGAVNFGITNSVGGFLILLGTGLLYGRTGALNLAQMGESLTRGGIDGLVVVAFTLLVAGFLVKAAAVPFHFWLADAHAVAPTPVCVIFSGVMVELGIYAVARIYWDVFGGALGTEADAVRTVLVAVGTVTCVIGATACFAQRHLKRLLAFSTVAHAGMFLIGVAVLAPEGLAGTGIAVLSHGMVKGALFICVGIVLHRLGSIDEDDLLGRGREMPYTGALFVVGGLALAGLPPFGSAEGKHLIELAAEHHTGWWVIALFVATSAVSAGAVLRAGGRIFLGRGGREEEQTPAEEAAADEQRETGGPTWRTPVSMALPALALLAGALAIGLWSPLHSGASSAAEAFADREAYVGAVLEGARAPLPQAPPPDPGGVLAAVLSAIGAVVLAALALERKRLSRRVRSPVWRSFRPVVAGLRAVHSGQVSDYVAWLTLGVAILGGAFAVTMT
jgi:multicomponent Na+:H+ antiporter subunit D